MLFFFALFCFHPHSEGYSANNAAKLLNHYLGDGKKATIKFTITSNQEGLVTGLLADGPGQDFTFNKN